MYCECVIYRTRKVKVWIMMSSRNTLLNVYAMMNVHIANIVFLARIQMLCTVFWSMTLCRLFSTKKSIKINTNNDDDVKNDISRRSLIDFARQLLKYWTVILLSRENSYYVCSASVLKCWDTIRTSRWQFCTFIALFTVSPKSTDNVQV